eukprot:8112834-Karenia_brevis.AAC.1
MQFGACATAGHAAAELLPQPAHTSKGFNSQTKDSPQHLSVGLVPQQAMHHQHPRSQFGACATAGHASPES